MTIFPRSAWASRDLIAEHAVAAMRRLTLPMRYIKQQFRRTAFNIVARNQDDHVKNIAFLMDKRGR